MRGGMRGTIVLGLLSACGSRSTRIVGDDGIGESDADADADDVDCGERRWQIDTVEAGDVGDRFAIALDGSGVPSVAYTRDGLVYARLSGSEWSHETVSVEDGVGAAGLALGIRPDGAAVVGVLDPFEGGERTDFAHFALAADGEWQKFGHGAEQRGTDLSCIVDSDGALRGAFIDDLNGVVYCNNVEEPLGQSMSFMGVPTPGDFPAIAVDPAGETNVSLRDPEGALVHAVTYGRSSEPGWSVETLAEGADRIGTSIAVDDSGAVQVAWVSGGAIRFSTNESGEWVTETAAPGPVSSTGISLDVSDDGAAHVAYLGADDVRYVSNDGGVWTDESIAPATTPGRVALATWNADGVHVVFVDSHGLRHATACVPGG